MPGRSCDGLEITLTLAAGSLRPGTEGLHARSLSGDALLRAARHGQPHQDGDQTVVVSSVRIELP